MTTPSIRGLWLAWALLFSLITGLSGGVMTYLSDDNLAQAVMAGAATFAGTAGLALLILSFLTATTPAPPPKN